MANPVLNSEVIQLSDRRRELMHRAMDGVYDLKGVMYILHSYKFCDNILIWLICHNYTGKNLSDLVVKKFRGSVPGLVDYVVAATNGGKVSNERDQK